jgi:hypothetical protein
MPETRDVRQILEMAERAAVDGDFSSAGELLRDAARIQEAELGPLHPDLANTLNNLAIVSEKTGRLGDAETFYRRAAAITSASLPADHPMAAESRQNLENFCREHGVPIASAAAASPEPPRSASTAPPVSLPVPREPSRPIAWVAVGVIGVLAVAVLVWRPWSARETSAPEPAKAQASESAIPPPPAPAPTEPPQPPKVAAPPADSRKAATPNPSSARSSGGISLTAIQLCQNFSTSGGRWRCDQVRDTVARGRIVLYTRVKSARDATVVHRWYREGVLQQAVRLPVDANASEGYRTYSRQTIDDGGGWRVEVRSADGVLLHEERFTVR